MKKLIATIIIIVLALLLYFFTHNEDKSSYELAKVSKGDLSLKVEAIGVVYAKNQVDVGSQVSGQVVKIYVHLGQFVKKGQKIAQIDKEKQQNNYDITKAKLQSARIALKSVQTAFDIAKSQFKRQQGLYTRMASSKTQLEEKEVTYYDLMAKKEESIALVAQLEISLKNAIKDLAYTKINAPMDGYVVNIAVEQGQIVNAVQSIPTIVRLANLSEMEIRMQIAEADIAKIKTGQKVIFSILSNPLKKYYSKVAKVDLANTQLSDAKSTPYDASQGQSAVYYYARAFVKNKDKFLRIGMSVQNEILIKSLKDVLIIPNTAIKQDEKGFYVRVLKNKKVSKKYVSLGAFTAFNAQVISGLKLGDEVIKR